MKHCRFKEPMIKYLDCFQSKTNKLYSTNNGPKFEKNFFKRWHLCSVDLLMKETICTSNEKTSFKLDFIYITQMTNLPEGLEPIQSHSHTVDLANTKFKKGEIQSLLLLCREQTVTQHCQPSGPDQHSKVSQPPSHQQPHSRTFRATAGQLNHRKTHTIFTADTQTGTETKRNSMFDSSYSKMKVSHVSFMETQRSISNTHISYLLRNISCASLVAVLRYFTASVISYCVWCPGSKQVDSTSVLPVNHFHLTSILTTWRKIASNKTTTYTDIAHVQTRGGAVSLIHAERPGVYNTWLRKIICFPATMRFRWEFVLICILKLMN